MRRTIVGLLAALVLAGATADVCFAAEGDQADTAKWRAISLAPFSDSINHARMVYKDRTPPYKVWPPERIVRIAENLLAWQGRDGGWPKNQDWPRAWTDAELAKIRKRQSGRTGGTLDNRNIYTQVRYLALTWQQTGETRYAEAAGRGLQWILRHQHPKSGGWRGSDVDAVTFNDDVMTGVLMLLRDIADSHPAYAWLDDADRAAVKQAYERGLRCVLDCQIRVNGRLTAWCQQHSHKDLRPVGARAYEKPSIVSAESVTVVRFLMGIEDLNEEIRTAIQSAVAWFDRVKIEGIRWQTIEAPPQRFAHRFSTHDRIVVKDPAAPPIWARFYDLRTEEPFFCTRGGKIVKDVAKLSRERREGYAWYGTWPAALLERDYPAWQRKWAPGQNVLRRNGGKRAGGGET